MRARRRPQLHYQLGNLSGFGFYVAWQAGRAAGSSSGRRLVPWCGGCGGSAATGTPDGVVDGDPGPVVGAVALGAGPGRQLLPCPSSGPRSRPLPPNVVQMPRSASTYIIPADYARLAIAPKQPVDACRLPVLSASGRRVYLRGRVGCGGECRWWPTLEVANDCHHVR
jgi:hypothetical protein